MSLHVAPIEAEPWEFPEQSLALLDRVASRVRPEEPALEEWSADYFREHRARLAGDLRIIGRHVRPGARVLEYGSVPLVMTAALAELGYAVSGLDVRPERFTTSIANLGLRVARCDVETEPVPFPTDAFDVVLFSELFEHLRINPVFTMREACRVLAPEGRLLLSTPNLRSFRGIRNLLLRNQGHAVSTGVFEQYEKLDTLGHMGHVREYTTREVADLLTRVGFRVERIIFRGGHGRGVVGIAERFAPSMRPFFTLVASKAAPPVATTPRVGGRT